MQVGIEGNIIDAIDPLLQIGSIHKTHLQSRTPCLHMRKRGLLYNEVICFYPRAPRVHRRSFPVEYNKARTLLVKRTKEPLGQSKHMQTRYLIQSLTSSEFTGSSLISWYSASCIVHTTSVICIPCATTFNTEPHGSYTPV